MIVCKCCGCGRAFDVITTVDPTGVCLTLEGFASTREQKAPHCPCGSTTFIVTTEER